jgi:soluble lytic murein transglycosylase
MVKRCSAVGVAIFAALVTLPWHTPSAAAPAPQTPADVVLVPTNHARLPADLSQLWMAPARLDATRPTALAQFAAAVKLEVDGQWASALPILVRVTPLVGPLRGYGEYYTGLAHLRVGRPAQARDIFHSLVLRAPDGYLAEAAALREAESDQALGDSSAALAVYEALTATQTSAPEDVLMRLGKAAQATGDRDKAVAAFSRVYYEYPLSDQALLAAAELNAVSGYSLLDGTGPRAKLELARGERLFTAKRYPDARMAFENLRRSASGDDRELVELRAGECEYFLKRPRAARDLLRPYIDKASRQGEALYFYAAALRDLHEDALYLTTVRRVVDEFPSQSWAEDALNNLATYYILQDDDARAEQVFRKLVAKYPSSRHGERAAWKIGWWAYKNGRYDEAVRSFDRGAAGFPRSDYRPAWLYWAARAYDGLQQPGLARARYTLVATDYLNSYYGRLAVRHLDGQAPERRLIVNVEPPSAPVAVSAAVTAPGAEDLPTVALPRNEPVIRALLGLRLYDQALDELTYAQKVWGDSPAIQATTAWIYRQQGLLETGARQFTLLRGSITTMRRAYPQFLAAGGEGLPKELLQVIFPVSYWELIRKYSAESGLDPYLVAALIAQESTFVPDVRSSANAVGLMQLLPSTARQYAKRLKIAYSAKALTTPETNIRLGTAYLADKMKEFGQLHLVLATYNAGERVVRRWMSERPSLVFDEFVDDIPYPETQNYVKKVVGTADDYRRLYGSEVEAVPANAVAPRQAVPPSRVASASAKAAPASPRKKAAASHKKARASRRPAAAA